jgi:phage shock protein E
MKKLLTIILTLATIFTLTSCDKTSDDLASVATKGKASLLEYDAKEATQDEYTNLKSFEILPKDTLLLIQAHEALKVVDVREPDEYADGHIPGAILLPLGQLSEASLINAGILKSDDIVVYCRSGRRSAEAYEIMTALGYHNTNSMAGGILRWSEDSLPVE